LIEINAIFVLDGHLIDKPIIDDCHRGGRGLIGSASAARYQIVCGVKTCVATLKAPKPQELDMSSTQAHSETAIETPRAVDMKLEVVVIPVSDVDRAKRFYGGLGWRLDADFAAGDDFRVIQFTPPGSGCSIIFGKNVTAAAPGSAQGLYLIVSDIKAARDKLLGRGVEISEVFHDAGGAYAGTDEPYLFGRLRVSGPDPEHRSYRSFASFSDPDSNGWLLQEVTVRLPGRVDADDTTFTSSTELASALRRAAAAHGEHEKRTGQQDANWPDWYAEYIVREQAGKELPS
jgi:catechol 2,3-dioxygenase-like lactoylglutathione lyase family enzyme